MANPEMMRQILESPFMQVRINRGESGKWKRVRGEVVLF